MFKKYYRLTKPGIIYGNALNTTAGFLFASAYQGEFDIWLLVAVLLGSSFVIAAGCVINNYIDRGIDEKMARTHQRALVQGTVQAETALVYGALLGIMGFTVLSLYTNWQTVAVGAVGFFFYVVLYSIFKRRSVYGTLVGSVSGAVPPVAGYAAVTNQLDTGAILLFMILVCWQMPHFYAIALYRLKDYRAAGIPVWPVKKGIRSTKIQMVVFIIAFTVAAALLTVYGYTGIIYLAAVLAAGITWFIRAIEGLEQTDAAVWGRSMFRFSLLVTLVLCAALSIGPLLP